MWTLSSRTVTLLFFLAFSVTTGCTTATTAPNVVQRDKLDQLEQIEIDGTVPVPRLHVDYQASQLNLNVPVAAVTAAQVAAATSAGSRDRAIAGGIIGTYVGVKIAQAAHMSRLQREADAPVQSLKTQVDHQRLQSRTVESFETALADALQPAIDARIDPAGQKPASRVLRSKLKVTLNPDMTAIHLRAELQISTRNSAATGTGVIYSREFDYHDTPLLDLVELREDERAAEWSKNKAGLFWKRLAIATESLARLVARDIQGLEVSRTPGGNPIYFENHRGLFYERGDILDTTEDRVLILTLRNGIISVPGTLVKRPGA